MFPRHDPKERLHFYRPAAVPGIELMSAFDSLDPWHVYHERYAVCACRTAQARMLYRRREEVLVDRGVSFMEPGEMHRNTEVHKRSDFKVLLVDPEAFARAAGEAGAGRAPHFRLAQVNGDERLFDAVYRLGHAIEHGAPALEQQSRFFHCVGLFLQLSERVPREAVTLLERPLEAARRRLIERAHENVTLDELAAVAGMSPFHFVRAFTRRVGMSPHRFQVHVRVDKAAAMIRRGVPPSHAATAAGFADQSHMNRHFKRIWRATPGEYAHARR